MAAEDSGLKRKIFFSLSSLLLVDGNTVWGFAMRPSPRRGSHAAKAGYRLLREGILFELSDRFSCRAIVCI